MYNKKYKKNKMYVLDLFDMKNVPTNVHGKKYICLAHISFHAYWFSTFCFEISWAGHAEYQQYELLSAFLI